MILTKEIKVELTKFNYHHYKRIGYDTDDKEFIMVRIEDIGNRTPTKMIVNNLTNRIKKSLYKDWDGYDYYDKDYIHKNLLLGFNNIDYPTIDHKISVFIGYKEGLLPTEIASIENLCITKRKNNSSKGYKTEEDYIKQKIQS